MITNYTFDYLLILYHVSYKKTVDFIMKLRISIEGFFNEKDNYNKIIVIQEYLYCLPIFHIIIRYLFLNTILYYFDLFIFSFFNFKTLKRGNFE